MKKMTPYRAWIAFCCIFLFLVLLMVLTFSWEWHLEIVAALFGNIVGIIYFIDGLGEELTGESIWRMMLLTTISALVIFFSVDLTLWCTANHVDAFPPLIVAVSLFFWTVASLWSRWKNLEEILAERRMQASEQVRAFLKRHLSEG